MITLATISIPKALAILFAGSLFLAIACCAFYGLTSNPTTWNDRGTNDDDK